MQSSLKWAVLSHIRDCNNWKSFKQIHAHIVRTDLLNNDLVSNAVIDYFCKYIPVLDYACDYLKHFDWRFSTFPFNALVSRYSVSNVPRTGLLVYAKLVRRGFVPDTFTFPPLLKSCTKFLGVREGRQVHGVVVRMGFSGHVYVGNSLVHFYSVCGDCNTARVLFDGMLERDVVSWSCLISGYVRTGLFSEAVELFSSMDVEPNASCFVSALVGCAQRGFLSLGMCIHGAVLKRPVEGQACLVLGNALMDMYMKCDCLVEARWVFDELPERDVVSWNCMISGSHPVEALEFFDRMLGLGGTVPDNVILTSVLSACASVSALDRGKWVHEYINRKGIKWDAHIGTAMIDMYAKCGCIDLALKTFDEMRNRNVVTWNALLKGLAMHGHGQEAIDKFEEMKRLNHKPNEITYLAVLTACCHSGLVDQGRRYFHQMDSPRIEHYGSMVDLLCRARLVDEAHKLISTMPVTPDVSIWGSLLSACNATGNIELSKEISDRIFELGYRDSGAFVLLSNAYAAGERWGDVTRLREAMMKKGIRKAPGSSLVTIDGIELSMER